MKRIYFLILALLTLVGGVNAKKVEKEKWTGNEAISWNSDIPGTQFETPSGTFSGLAVGDIIKIYTEVTGVEYGDPQYVVTYKAGSGWEWTDLAISFDNNVISYTVSEATVASEIAYRGLVFRGQNWTATKITLTTSETETSTTSVWSGTHNLGNYSGLELTGDTYKSVLKDAKIGDILRATYTSENAGYIDFCNGSSWATLIGGSFSVTATSENATVEYEITSATVLEAIQQNGIVMNGTNADLSAIDLLTYSTSYDAVSIKVGSEGVATYSNGGKNVQISACDALRAYYASAVAEGTVTLTELTGCIPASTGVMIYGAEGTYTVPVGGEGWPSIPTNYLKATGDYSAEVAASTVGTYHYIFAKDRSDGKIAFFKLTSNYTLAAHKAYLETEVTQARLVLRFDDDPTAIAEIKNEVKEVQQDNVYYNLNGQRVERPTKGIYILNGKKVLF